MWAYKRWQGEREKPDLRAIRWNWGGKRHNKFYRLEIEIPDDMVLLSDYESWIVILNEGLLADTEDEYDELDKIYASLSLKEQKKMRSENWEKFFDITPFKNEYTGRGETVQATFWELHGEQIRKVTMFITKESKRI